MDGIKSCSRDCSYADNFIHKGEGSDASTVIVCIMDKCLRNMDNTIHSYGYLNMSITYGDESVSMPMPALILVSMPMHALILVSIPMHALVLVSIPMLALLLACNGMLAVS